MRFRIGLFAEMTSIYAFQKILPRMFGDSGHITQIKTDDLADPTRIEKFDMLVLPGVDTENSPYHALFNSKIGETIFNHIHDNGAALWASCAPVYDLLETYSYTDSQGKTTTNKGLGLIRGHAKGPAWQGRALDPSGRDFNATICVDTHIAGPDLQTPIRTKLPYANGPALQKTNPEQLQALAKYGHDYQAGDTATGYAKHGKGLILASGVLPEVSLEQADIFAENGTRLPGAQRFYDQLKPHNERRKILATNMARILSGQMRQKLG